VAKKRAGLDVLFLNPGIVRGGTLAASSSDTMLFHDHFRFSQVFVELSKKLKEKC
jgi:hypothetical protein